MAANSAHRPVTIENDIVTRSASTASATVFGFLEHLRGRGLRCVPEPLDLAGGLERLRLLPGASGAEGWYHQHTDQGLASAARLLRSIHDAGRDWSPPPDAVWGAPAGGGGEEIVFCHGDPGPWNFVWSEQEAVGLIDWDYLHPAPRMDDVAYALHWFVPLRRDEFALDWHHFPAVPDRRRRMEVFLQTYGPDVLDRPALSDVAAAVEARIRATADLTAQLAAAGQEPQRSWVADGALERQAAELGWIRSHRDDLFD